MKRTLFAALLAGCATTGHGSSLVGPPKEDRCAAPGVDRSACEKARFDAIAFVRKLSVDDQICIDGEHELSNDSRACNVRAFVEGVAPNAVQLEIRGAADDSPYKMGAEYWFEERALADVQLKALGYGAR